jgi:hypothetical protein
MHAWQQQPHRRFHTPLCASGDLVADCVFLPSDRIHAPNERLLLADSFCGVRAAAYPLEELARPEVVAAQRARRG